MILPGRSLTSRNIIRGVISRSIQAQPCGVDLTLKKVLTWTSAGAVDFDNKLRQTASLKEIPFSATIHGSLTAPADIAQDISRKDYAKHIHLACGSYLIEFNETISVPLDAMGQIFIRSSLFRSGALLSTGVIDSGYSGAVGALLQVGNPSGLRLYENARLAQAVFHQMSEPVEGYTGVYQGSAGMD